MRWWIAFTFGLLALVLLIDVLLSAPSYAHAVQDVARHHRACARPAAAVAVSACRYGPALLLAAGRSDATLRLPDGRMHSVEMETAALEALQVVPAVAVETPGPGIPVTIQTWGGRIMLIALAGHVVRTTDNPDVRVPSTTLNLALFGGVALVCGAICLYFIRQAARQRRPRDPLQPTLREVLIAPCGTAPRRTGRRRGRRAMPPRWHAYSRRPRRSREPQAPWSRRWCPRAWSCRARWASARGCVAPSATCGSGQLFTG